MILFFHILFLMTEKEELFVDDTFAGDTGCKDFSDGMIRQICTNGKEVTQYPYLLFHISWQLIFQSSYTTADNKKISFTNVTGDVDEFHFKTPSWKCPAVAKCNAFMDIVIGWVDSFYDLLISFLIVLDNSNGMISEDIPRVRDFLSTIVDSTVLGFGASRIGIVTFSSASNIVSPFDTSKQNLLNLINSISFIHSSFFLQ